MLRIVHQPTTVVGNEERVVRQIVAGKIDRKLCKGHQVPGLRAVLAHVGEIRERIVMLDVTAGIAARISNGGQVFGVLLPSLAGGDELSNDVCGQPKMGAAQLLTVTEMGAGMASLLEVSWAWIVIVCAALVS